MATSSETFGQGKAMSRGAWTLLVVVALLAVALAAGGYAISTRSTSEPAVATQVTGSDTVVVPLEGGLIKGGLQPRPYAAIVAPPETVVVDIPAGFVRVGTDFRPMPVEQRP